MAEVKVRKKDIKEARKPDALLEGATNVFDWIYERRTMVIAAVVALLVVVGIISFATSHSASGKHEVGAALGSALELGSRPVIEKKDAAAGADEKTFPSQDAKNKAVGDALAKVEKDHEGSAAGRSAALDLAHLEYVQGKYDDAIKGYEDYLKGGDDAELRLFALEGLGYAYEAKGDLQKASDSFAKLADAGAPGRAEYQKGRLLEKQGKKDEAKKAYEDVIANHEKEVAANDARTRLELLNLPPEGQGSLEAPAAPAADEAPKGAKKGGKAQGKTAPK